MPILNCYISKPTISPTQWNNLVAFWAKMIGVDQKDICLHIFTTFSQAGAKYRLKMELYLPSLWPNQEVKNIQQCLITALEECLDIEPKSVFLITQIIQSNHVIDRGKLEQW